MSRKTFVVMIAILIAITPLLASCDARESQPKSVAQKPIVISQEGETVFSFEDVLEANEIHLVNARSGGNFVFDFRPVKDWSISWGLANLSLITLMREENGVYTLMFPPQPPETWVATLFILGKDNREIPLIVK